MKKTVLICDICKEEFEDTMIDEIINGKGELLGTRKDLKARHKIITPMGIKEIVIDEICGTCAKIIVVTVDKLWKEV